MNTLFIYTYGYGHTKYHVIYFTHPLYFNMSFNTNHTNTYEQTKQNQQQKQKNLNTHVLCICIVFLCDSMGFDYSKELHFTQYSSYTSEQVKYCACV